MFSSTICGLQDDPDRHLLEIQSRCAVIRLRYTILSWNLTTDKLSFQDTTYRTFLFHWKSQFLGGSIIKLPGLIWNSLQELVQDTITLVITLLRLINQSLTRLVYLTVRQWTKLAITTVWNLIYILATMLRATYIIVSTCSFRYLTQLCCLRTFTITRKSQLNTLSKIFCQGLIWP